MFFSSALGWCDAYQMSLTVNTIMSSIFTADFTLDSCAKKNLTSRVGEESLTSTA